MSLMENICHHYGDAPDCLRETDDRYTLNFTDVEGGSMLHYCSTCGRRSHALLNALNNAMESQPGFTEVLEKAVDEVEATRPRQS